MELQYEYRVGIGTDIHKLEPERTLKLGGVEIPFEMGLVGHSDGDVVLHAVIDAILGASGLGDIGTLFPSSDPQLKGIDSRELVLTVRELYRKHGWEIGNADLIIHAEQPRLEGYKGQIKRCVSGLLDVDFAHVNVKAKTHEGMGPVGMGRAIEATAVVLMRRRIKTGLGKP
jgi:2-C-methyl-D-erythritol 2,4-cyclodiphosphate synthase